MCIRNREYFIKMGDIPSSSKFEKYAADSKKDLHMLMIRRNNGDPIPSYRVEERTFSIVVANLDVPLNELHVEVIRAFDFSGTPTIDTYVRADFPFPSVSYLIIIFFIIYFILFFTMLFFHYSLGKSSMETDENISRQSNSW